MFESCGADDDIAAKTLMKRRCVITGMGVVSPNGVGTTAFADAVLEGRSGVKRITRFDASEIKVQIAGEVSGFDELAWVEKKERKHVSRVLPFALCASSEALQSAGLDAASLPLEERRRFGVIIGSGGGASEFTEEQYRLFFHQQYSKMSLFCVPTGVMGSLSSELSVRFALRGASHVITTGCTSSTDAMAYAMRQIESGRLDWVLTGGADAPISLGTVKGFILLGIVTEKWNQTPEKGSRPFSKDRDGFVVAEGAWMFVLEEYEHAKARGANDSGRGCWIRIDLRGVSPGAAEGVRRRAGASDWAGDDAGGDRAGRRRLRESARDFDPIE